MTSGDEIVLLSYGPAQSPRVPEDEPVLEDVFVHGPLHVPGNSCRGGDGVVAVALGVVGLGDHQVGAHHRHGSCHGTNN